MIIGTVREIKPEEYRAGLTPEGAHALVVAGHRVLVETQTGAGVGFSDEAYAACGATVIENAWEVWARADLLVKVKEPLEPEHSLVRDNQTLFTYLHLAALPELTRVLIASKVTAIAYETVQLRRRIAAAADPDEPDRRAGWRRRSARSTCASRGRVAAS